MPRPGVEPSPLGSMSCNLPRRYEAGVYRKAVQNVLYTDTRWQTATLSAEELRGMVDS